MKSLFLALIFFGVVVYGCYDVTPYKRALRRVIRRTPKPAGRPSGTGPIDPMPYEPPRRHYR